MLNQQRDALVAFTGARYDEDEAAAQAAARFDGKRWHASTPKHEEEYDQSVFDEDGANVVAFGLLPGSAAHMARYDPAWVLADIAIKRRILAEVVEQIDDMDARIEGEWGSGSHTTGESDLLLSLLALPYAGHPDYRPEWAPTTPAR